VTELARETWPEVEAVGAPMLVLPLGALEQHGPHLPLDTDTRIAEALARRLGARRPEALVAPVLPFGASGEHAGFPGTLSLGHGALEHALVELVRSADWCAGVVVVNWHGGNTRGLWRAVRTLQGESRNIACWSGPGRARDAHAGRCETSLMLALDPAAVRLELAAAGDVRPLGRILPALRERGVRAVSPNGVLGDPAGASAEEGRWLLAELESELAGFYDATVLAAAR
jgi:mycofactocin precursor peptide peptidase